MKPWKHRPPDNMAMDWEDRPLSNSLAWASEKIAPKACEDGTWTFRLADKLWAECSCCLFWRGVLVGLTGGLLGCLLISLIF